MKVKFFATYRPVTGCTQLDAPMHPDVLSLLEWVIKRYPALRYELLDKSGTELGEETIVLVNGRHIQHMNGVGTKLTEEDTVSLFPLVAGG